MGLLKGLWFMLLGRPQGVPMVIRCAWCEVEHIDQGIWVYRAHSKHLCHYCGRTFYKWTPSGAKPTRGV